MQVAERVPGWVRFFIACRGLSILVTIFVVVLASFMVAADPIAIPTRNGVSSLVWPLLPAVLACSFPPMLASLEDDLHRTSPRDALGMRGVLIIVILVADIIVTLGAYRFSPVVELRNAALLSGAALLLCACRLARYAWIPIVIFSIFGWLLGTSDVGVIASWALLLQPAESAYSWVISAGVAITGAALYLWFPFRGLTSVVGFQMRVRA